MKNIYQIVGLLLIILFVSPLATQAQFDLTGESEGCKDLSKDLQKKGGEQVPVFDESNVAVNTISASALEALYHKECVLDVQARAEAKRLLDEATNATIKFINTGYRFQSADDIIDGGEGESRPFYVADPISFFQEVTDRETAVFSHAYLEANEDSPFANQLIATIEQNQTTILTYDLDEYVSDPEAFIKEGTLDEGENYWDAWDAITNNPHNSPLTSYYVINERLSVAQNKAVGRVALDLEYGDGFLSQRDDNGNIEKPSSTIRDQFVNITTQELRVLETTDEVGEIADPDKETELTEQIADEDTSIADYDVNEYGGGLNIGEDLDFDILRDGFDLTSLMNFNGIPDLQGLLEHFDVDDFGDLINSIQNLPLFGNFDPHALLEVFGLESLTDIFGADILQDLDLGTIISQSGIEDVLSQFSLSELVNAEGGMGNLLNILNQEEMLAVLDDMNINPGEIVDVPDLLEEISNNGFGVTMDDLDQNTIDRITDILGS